MHKMFCDKQAIFLAILLPALLLGGCNVAPTPESGNVRGGEASQALPGAVETPVLPSTIVPDAVATARSLPPTSTPDLAPPPTLPPLPPPPIAASLPVDPAAPAPNVAWSAETDSSLTIWVGHYGDDPAPGITGARAVARWDNKRRRLASMAASPDGRSLATLMYEPCEYVPEPTPTPDLSGTPQVRLPNVGFCEGDWPQHIFVIDLTTNRVQSIPDYYGHYELYAENSYPSYEKMLGWFDNDRLGIAQKNGQIVTATKDGASFIKRTWPGQSEYDYIYDTTLLPDHKTIFASIGDGFFFRDAPTGAVRKAGEKAKGAHYSYIFPSPDGKRIGYLEIAMVNGSDTEQQWSLWIQELASGERHHITNSNVWDARPAWSPDGTQIAFVQATALLAGVEAWWMGTPEKAYTNIHVAGITDFTSRPLTAFANAHNSGLQWTLGGNLILSSTVDSSTGAPGIVAVSTVDGRATVLVSATPGERLVHPLVFASGLPKGMPRAGDSTQP